MIHQSDHRYIAVNNVKKTGDASTLAVGQAGLFFETRLGARGKQAVDVSNMTPFPAKEKFVIKAGIPGGLPYSGKPKKDASTFPFDKSQIFEVGVSAPTDKELKVDKVVIGFDGSDASTAPVLYPGETRAVTLVLTGDVATFIGYNDGIATFEYTVAAPLCPDDQCDNCDPCEPVDMLPIFERLMEQIKETRLPGGNKLGDVLNVYLVKKCSTEPGITEEEVDEFIMSVPDGGTYLDLQAVQATTNGKVERVGYAGGVSTYSVKQFPIFPLTNTSLVIREGNFLADCDTCPTGYTKSNTGGVVYNVRFNVEINTGQTNQAAIVAAFPGTKNGNVLKYTDEKANQSVVAIIANEVVTKEDLDTFLASDPNILDVEVQGEVSTICIATATQTYAWQTTPATCTVTKVLYYIDLQDLDCDGAGSRLAELQRAYPYNNVTSLGQQAACISRYQAEVYTNEICKDCQNSSDTYKAHAPLDYQGAEWKCVEGVAASGCMVGIKLEGKILELFPNECLRGVVPFYLDSARIKVSAGWNRTNTIANPSLTLKPWSVKYLQAANEITHLGANLMPLVSKDLQYFIGESESETYIERFFKGEEPIMDMRTQYVDYWVTLGRINRYAHGYKHSRGVTYHFLVEFGKHQDVEDMMNALAELGGQPPVSADASL